MTKAKRLRTLEKKNAKFKNLLAEAILDIPALTNISTKMMKPGAKQPAAVDARNCHGLSQQRAYDLISIASGRPTGFSF